MSSRRVLRGHPDELRRMKCFITPTSSAGCADVAFTGQISLRTGWICRLLRSDQTVGASYTRYADDLVFSGNKEFARDIDRFYIHVCASPSRRDLKSNAQTRIMRQSVSHAPRVVLNQRMNVGRAYYDASRQFSTHCIIHGPAGQNRDGVKDFRRIDRRIAHVEMCESRARQKTAEGVRKQILERQSLKLFLS